MLKTWRQKVFLAIALVFATVVVVPTALAAPDAALEQKVA